MGLGHFQPLDNNLTKALPLSCPPSEGGDTKERRHAWRHPRTRDPNLELIKTVDKLYEHDWRSRRYSRYYVTISDGLSFYR
jgi:hypothetical protein